MLIEIIASKNGPVDDRTVARVIERLYEIGIHAGLVEARRPGERSGVGQYRPRHRNRRSLMPRRCLLLGLEAPEKDLAQAFALAHNCSLVKGFAVGRTIFVEPAVEWFAGRIDDREAVERMAAAFARLCDLWRDGGRTREAEIERRDEKQ